MTLNSPPCKFHTLLNLVRISRADVYAACHPSGPLKGFPFGANQIVTPAVDIAYSQKDAPTDKFDDLPHQLNHPARRCCHRDAVPAAGIQAALQLFLIVDRLDRPHRNQREGEQDDGRRQVDEMAMGIIDRRLCWAGGVQNRASASLISLGVCRHVIYLNNPGRE